MTKPSPLRLHWPALLVLAVVVCLGGLAWLLPADSDVRKAATVLWTGVPIALIIAQYMYAKVERFRLTINRCRFWLSNPESTWGLTAEYEVTDAFLAWKHAAEALEGTLQRGDKALTRAEGNAVWITQGMTVQVALDNYSDPFDGDQAILRVEIPPVTRPFRTWHRAIEDEAIPLIERIERAIDPQGRKFVTRVKFPGDNNPYFGLFIAQVSRTAVTRVDVEYFEHSADEEDAVRVLADRLEVITSSLLSAQRLSLRYLALTATPAKS
jgi:hypothetical protein